MQEKIVQFLKKSQGYLSGEEISRSLNISRAAIWKHIQDLRELGYEIVAVPHRGYQLAACPDKLFPNEIQFDLKTKILGKRVIYHEMVHSTMNEAFNLGVQGAPEGTVICADGQSKGRGRLGRHWSSLKGQGIYMSIILRPRLSPAEVSKLTLLCAVGVSQAINKITGLNTSIKWPNDILFHGKKLGGILTELNAEADRVKFVVVGIGVNVKTKIGSLPHGATSLKNETKDSVSRVSLAKEILRQIEQWYIRFDQEGFSLIAQKWRELSATLTKQVRIQDSSGLIEGEAVDIDQDGGLLVRKANGVVVKKMAGDVVLVK